MIFIMYYQVNLINEYLRIYLAIALHIPAHHVIVESLESMVVPLMKLLPVFP